MKSLFVIFLCIPTIAFASIGSVIKHEGIGSIKRETKTIQTEIKTKIKSNDNVRVGQGNTKIQFVDKTVVAISAHSKLVIDSFVFDPKNANKSKMSLLFSAGTIRYASGLLAKRNRKRVNIRTPTATIGIRGTNFAATTNELGQSLIINLPNSDGTIGEIMVTTGVASVIMAKAFQATMITSGEVKPSKPVILKLNPNQINNLLMVVEPDVKRQDGDQKDEEGEDQEEDEGDDPLGNELDKSQVELDVDYLADNELDVELLVNLLDQILDDIDITKQVSVKRQVARKVSGIVTATDGNDGPCNKQTKICKVIEGDTTTITRNEENNVQLKINNQSGASISIDQGGTGEVGTNVGEGGSGNIEIRQN